MTIKRDSTPTLRGYQVADAVETGEIKIADLSDEDYLAYMDVVDPYIDGAIYDYELERDGRETVAHAAEVRAWEDEDRAWNEPF